MAARPYCSSGNCGSHLHHLFYRRLHRTDIAMWHTRNSRTSIESADTDYRRLSFEYKLFTVTVYKRNYRNPPIRSLFHQEFLPGLEVVVDTLLLFTLPQLKESIFSLMARFQPFRQHRQMTRRSCHRSRQRRMKIWTPLECPISLEPY